LSFRIDCFFFNCRWTTKEFKPLRKVYENNFADYLEAGSQMAVYLKGEKVVDLWGNNPSVAPSYSNSTFQRVFSSGKVVESLVAIMCVDRGLFAWSDAIAQHWPEFAQHGKERITVSDLMRHEAGFLFVHSPTLLPQSLASLLPPLFSSLSPSLPLSLSPSLPLSLSPSLSFSSNVSRGRFDCISSAGYCCSSRGVHAG
jgi:Beta-lactamase